MRSKGDRYRRQSCYTEGARRNDAAAAQMAMHHAELAHLVTDDLTAEVFQDTYCRITVRYTDGDFVREFKATFWNTLREYIIHNRIDSARYAILSEDPKEEAEDAEADR